MSGLPSPSAWDEPDLRCEQCGERDADVSWHEDHRRNLHPDCVGPWVADSMSEDRDDR